MDAATGLLYVGDGQYYDPSTGRFLTRTAKPNQTNPYLPFDPAGAMLGPLGVLALVLGSKKKKSKYDVLLFVLVFAIISGFTLTACGDQEYNVTATITPVVTPGPSSTQSYIVSATATPTNGGPTEYYSAVVTATPNLIPTLLPECATAVTPSPIPTATPATLTRLSSYGVTLTNNPDAIWQEVDALAVLYAVEAVARKMASFHGTVDEFVAFQRVYGSLIFNKVVSFIYNGRTFTDGACACGGGSVVTVARLARKGDVRTEQMAFDLNRNNIVHELGHLFAGNWRETVNGELNPNNPYYMYLDSLLTEDGWPVSPVGASLMWRQHPSRMDGGTFDRGEVFADMFLGWIFGVFADDDAGIGDLRRNEMDRIMRIKLQELLQ
jgi:hypothetical protein